MPYPSNPSPKRAKRLWLALTAGLLALAPLAQARESLEPVPAPQLLATDIVRQPTRALVITFADDGFDYYGKSAGVMQLAFAQGTLTLRLANAGEAGARYRFDEIRALSRDDFNAIYRQPDHTMSWGAKRRAQADERERLQTLAGVKHENGGLSVRHQRADLGPTMAYYLDALSGFGFVATPMTSQSNVRAFQLQSSAQHARIVFTRSGNDVQVWLSGAGR